MPEMMTCPSIAGVTTTFTTTMPGRAGRLAACPGRGREERLALRQVVGPDGDLLFLLPLERHHLVRDLESVRIDLVVAEDRAHTPSCTTRTTPGCPRTAACAPTAWHRRCTRRSA